jgi:hypothetical protein
LIGVNTTTVDTRLANFGSYGSLSSFASLRHRWKGKGER